MSKLTHVALILKDRSRLEGVSLWFTRVERRAGLAGFSKAMFRVGTAAFRLRHCPREWTRTRAHLYCAVAGGAHVGVDTDTAVHVDGQPWRALATE